VDDDTGFRRLLTRELTGQGFRINSLSTGEEAVARVSEGDIDVVLMDIRLGPGMDGIAAAGEIVKNYPDVGVVFVSGLLESEERIEASGLSSLGFIEKPFHLGALSSVIESATYRGRHELDKVKDKTAPSPESPPVEQIIHLDTIDLILYKQLEANPDLLKALTWRTFERLLADILETFGYSVQLMQGTKDGGIDIIALGKPKPWGEHRYLLQAKRWSNKVGVAPVRELKFLHDHLGASRSCLATTGEFTRGAWRLSEEYHWELELQDYTGIRRWIDEAIKLKWKASPGA
jgi:CheY-like chemotaxis protein/HJR/Mrr/RecB family endonuclease